MQGPAGDAATERGASIVAARLMREWIARMEADGSQAWIAGKSYGEKIMEQEKDYKFRRAVQFAYDQLIKVCDEYEYIDAVFVAIKSETGIAPKGWEVTP